MSIVNVIGSLLKDLNLDKIQIGPDAAYVPLFQIGGPKKTGGHRDGSFSIGDEYTLRRLYPEYSPPRYPSGAIAEVQTDLTPKQEIAGYYDWKSNKVEYPSLRTTVWDYDRDGYNPLKGFGPIGTHKPEEDESKILPLSFLEGFMNNEIAGVPYTLPHQKLPYKGGDGKVKFMMSPFDFRSDKEKWLHHTLRYRV